MRSAQLKQQEFSNTDSVFENSCCSAQLKQQEFSNTESGATLGRNALSAEKARVEQTAATEKDRIGEEKKDHDLAIEVLDKAVSLVNEEFGSAFLQANAKNGKAA